MNTKPILFWLATLLLVASCISEPLVEGGAPGESMPCPVTLSIRGDRFPGGQDAPADPLGNIPTGRALTDEKEAAITQLHLLVFDSNGEAVLNERFKNLTLTDGAYRLKTEIVPGNGMQFYAIANADVTGLFTENLPVLLYGITRLSELETLIATLQADVNGLNRTDRLVMIGNATVNVSKPHREAIPLVLNYLAAKVTVTLTDNTNDKLDIDITGWDMVNVPRKSYLATQAGQDAVTGTKPEDYLTTASKFPFETVNEETKSWAQTCYLLENRRGGRVGRPDPTNPADRYPGMSVTDDDQRGKAWYAPPGATYLLVYGTHTQDGQKNNILYKIYLGGNAVNDYNLARGKHYQYNVSINGLNDINVDTNVEWGAASFTVDKSDNLVMDAHPDVRVLRIGGTATDATTPGYATVEVVSGSTWLALSPLNLYRHAVKQAGNAGEHQQFGAADGVGSFVRSRYTPTPTASTEFGDQTAFGMTHRLTRIPFTQLAVCTYQDVLVYADAYTGGGERTGQVRIIYYKGANGDEVAGQQTLTITQSGAMEISAHLQVERYEESAMQLHPALASELQRTSFMQWGYGEAQLYSGNDRFCNGNYLTANAVYTNVSTRSDMAAPQWTASTYADYRPKYPRTGDATREPSSVTTSGTPYYYPDLTQSTLATDYFHPIYNSAAARYCHEKNRDLNGDGSIDASETLWYLPSYSDMMAIKKNPPTTNPLIGTYWTSTEESADKSWAFTFPAGTMEAVDKRTTNRVRCVQGTGTTMTEPTFESEQEEDKTKITLASEAGSSGIFRITDDKNFGIEWTVTSTTPAWLQLATDATGTSATTTQTGTGDATLYAYALTANPSKEEVRTATLTFTRALSVNQTIEVTQEFSTAIVGGNSNCYMVAPGTAISIPVERANESPIQLTGSTLKDGTYHQLQASTAWTASLVWESSKGLVALSEATGTGSAGRFNVTAPSTLAEGNAVVAIKNANNEILWSWHIWVTAYDGTTTFTNHNGKQNFVFMDRALGAASATAGQLSSCGLYYQWGRKDPLPGPGQQGGSWSITNDTDPIKVYNAAGSAYTITKTAVPSVTPNNLTNATRHPDTFYFSAAPPYDWFVQSGTQNDNLWSGSNIAVTAPAPKSVFDPCPAGWRVAPWLNSTSPFATMESGSTWGNYGRTWAGTGGYFPASGLRLNTSGGVCNVSMGGFYWSGSPDSTYGYSLYFGSGSVDPAYSSLRAYGLPVRCCRDNL